MRLWRGEDERTEAQALEWPAMVAWCLPSLALAFLALAVGIRAADGRLFPAVIFAAVAAVPWIVHLTGRFPEPVFVIVCVSVGMSFFLFRPENNEFSPFVMVLACGEITATTERRMGAVAAVVFSGLVVAGEAFGRYDGGVVWIVAFAVAFASGATYQQMVRLYTDLRRAQEDLANKAVADERHRIAREVHDVIAHSLAVTMLNITGARMALDRGNVPDAIEALHDAERLGRQSLNDVRQTVGLLGSPEDSSRAVEPSAADVADLVSHYRKAGLDVTLDVSGEPSDVSAAIGLGLYRITQEALANAVRHAPGSAVSIDLDLAGDAATLRVVNAVAPGTAPAAEGGGRGVPGIKDRAQSLGGRAAVGPAGQAWVVEVSVPLAAKAEAPAEEPA